MNFRVYCHIRGIGQLTSVCEELLKRIRSEELQRVPRCPSVGVVTEKWRSRGDLSDMSI